MRGREEVSSDSLTGPKVLGAVIDHYVSLDHRLVFSEGKASVRDSMLPEPGNSIDDRLVVEPKLVKPGGTDVDVPLSVGKQPKGLDAARERGKTSIHRALSNGLLPDPIKVALRYSKVIPDFPRLVLVKVSLDSGVAELTIFSAYKLDNHGLSPIKQDTIKIKENRGTLRHSCSLRLQSPDRDGAVSIL